ncbi:30S ribosomal protein S1 [bacterium]|nr:30S ribosomal protein S1 [bacterium]MBQ4438405.1 30S ribosomal protein S1 [bacterium]MBR6422106.1 30S ribosomal protein S1 [bacterium]
MSQETFEELLESYLPNKEENSGEKISKGIVRAIRKDVIIVDVGLKSDGVISASEFTPEELANLKVNDEIEVVVENWDGDRGMSLSKEKASKLKVWEVVEKAFQDGTLVNGTIVAKVNGGLAVDIGVKAFLPNSQVALRPIKNVDDLIGKTYDFKVIKFDKKKGNIVISRRDLLEKEREALKNTTLEKLQEGAIVKGLVKNITYYGVFVDLGGIDGLLHITDMSWGRVNHPSEMFKIGDEVDVKVLKYDKDSERVSLGVKQITDDPWIHATEKYAAGKTVKGVVVSLEDYGAFVELEKGVEGLIHISEMSWTRRIKHPGKMVAIGDEVEVKILEIDVENRRISLGMKQIEPNPWELLKDKYPVGTIVKGTIRNITDFGLFVGVEEGIDGLVRTSDITWDRKLKHPSEYYKKGDEIEAVVLNIDSEKQRFSLGIKQLTEDPWKIFKDQHNVGDKIEVEVVKVAEFGVFVKVFDTIEGLVHKTEFEDNKEYQPGDKLEVIIKSISDTDRKVSLSVKAVSDEENQKIVEEAEAVTEKVPEKLGSMAAAFKAAEEKAEEKPAE